MLTAGMDGAEFFPAGRGEAREKSSRRGGVGARQGSKLRGGAGRGKGQNLQGGAKLEYIS